MTAITQPPAPGTADELAASLVGQLFPGHTFVESALAEPIAIERIEEWCRRRLEAWLRREAPKVSATYTFDDSRRVAFDWLATTTMQHLAYIQLWPQGSEPVITRSLAGTTMQARQDNEYTVVNQRTPLFARGTPRERGGETVATFPKALGSWGSKDNALLDAVTDGGSEFQILQRTRRLLTEAFPELAALHSAHLRVRHGDWRDTAWRVLDRAQQPLLGGEEMLISDEDRYTLLDATITAIFEEIGTDDGDSIARERVPGVVVDNYRQYLMETEMRALDDDRMREYCDGWNVPFTPDDRTAMIQKIMGAFAADVQPLDPAVLVNAQGDKSVCTVFTEVLQHGVRPLFAHKNEPDVRVQLTQCMTLLAYYAAMIAIELRDCQHRPPTASTALLMDEGREDQMPMHRLAESEDKRRRREDAQRALQAFWETLSEIRTISGLELREVPMIVLVKFAMMSMLPMSRAEHTHLRTSL